MKNALVLGASALTLSVALRPSVQSSSSTIPREESGGRLTIDQSGSGNSFTVSQDGNVTGTDGVANEVGVTRAGTGGASFMTQTGDSQLTVTQSKAGTGLVAEVT